jgi:hypothetical protein
VLAAAAIALLLALQLAGAGFHGNPLTVVSEAGPADRLWEVADRRGPVLGATLLAWLAAFVLALAVERARTGAVAGGRAGPGRLAARLLALSLVYLPLLLLVAAALDPSVSGERVLVLLGCPALGVLTLLASSRLVAVSGAKRELSGYQPLAVACGITVLAHAVDLVAGSPLIQLSLAGPNPAAGHRYYGIGNELEAALVVLVLVGTGAALSSFAVPPDGESPQRLAATRGAATFLAVGIVFSFVFAYGRYGADVGAAIVLPLGAAVAAALSIDRPRLARLALLVPLPALALLAAADLLTGSDAHLTRTVLQADGGGDVLGVVGRRLGEAGESFGRPLLLTLLPFVLVGALVAWLRRETIAAWLRAVPMVRAGLAGALAATLAGTVANDSGALLLEVGAVYLAAFVAYAWAVGERPGAARCIDYP